MPTESAPVRSGRRLLPGILIGLSLLATVISLRWEGHRWWCQLGDWNLGSVGIHSPHTSQHLVDPYSFTHVLHGMALYAALHWVARRWRRDARLVLAIMLECGWEIVENSPTVIERYRAGTIALGYNGDSVVNSLGDIGSCGLGFVLAGWLSVRASILLFLAVELGLLAAYRDNLLLNVIMLLHPIEAIKAWQARG